MEVVIPQLPGFAGRPLPADAPYWDQFMLALGKTVAHAPEANWVLYGHGIGGSLLLEWAARNYALPDGTHLQPEQVILHAPIGASLEHRFFPKLMKPAFIRHFMHWLIYQPAMQSIWEQRLFLYPDQIPADLRRQFFADYRTCAAFPVFFDLITPTWYRQTQQQLQNGTFHFIWGERERVVASKYLAFWERDFPQATVEIIPEWDHFPMLEQLEEFTHKMVQLIQRSSTTIS